MTPAASAPIATIVFVVSSAFFARVSGSAVIRMVPGNLPGRNREGADSFGIRWWASSTMIQCGRPNLDRNSPRPDRSLEKKTGRSGQSDSEKVHDEVGGGLAQHIESFALERRP